MHGDYNDVILSALDSLRDAEILENIGEINHSREKYLQACSSITACLSLCPDTLKVSLLYFSNFAAGKTFVLSEVAQQDSADEISDQNISTAYHQGRISVLGSRSRYTGSCQIAKQSVAKERSVADMLELEGRLNKMGCASSNTPPVGYGSLQSNDNMAASNDVDLTHRSPYGSTGVSGSSDISWTGILSWGLKKDRSPENMQFPSTYKSPVHWNDESYIVCEEVKQPEKKSESVYKNSDDSILCQFKKLESENIELRQKLDSVIGREMRLGRIQSEMVKFKREYTARFKRLRKFLILNESPTPSKSVSPLTKDIGTQTSDSTMSLSTRNETEQDKGHADTSSMTASPSDRERVTQLEKIVGSLIGRLDKAKEEIKVKDEKIRKFEKHLVQQRSASTAGGASSSSASIRPPPPTARHPSTATLETALNRPSPRATITNSSRNVASKGPNI